METGAELEVMPAQVREDYIAKVEEHTKNLKWRVVNLRSTTKRWIRNQVLTKHCWLI